MVVCEPLKDFRRSVLLRTVPVKQPRDNKNNNRCAHTETNQPLQLPRTGRLPKQIDNGSTIEQTCSASHEDVRP